MALDDAWMKDAACRGRDPETFLLSKHYGTARIVCSACPVRVECRMWCDEVEGFETNPNAIAAMYAGEVPKQRAQRRLNEARGAAA